MADQTPVKLTGTSCFVCYTTTSSRFFKLNGKKATSEGFSEKLTLILDDCSLTNDLVSSASVCLCCYKGIQNTHEFMLTVKRSAKNFFVKSDTRVKRCILLTPPACAPKQPKLGDFEVLSNKQPVEPENSNSLQIDLNEDPFTSSKSDLAPASVQERQLVPENILDSESTITMAGHDHIYTGSKCDGGEQPNSMSNLLDTLSHIIKQIQDPKTKDYQQLMDLRLQSSQLTSRTTTYSSVLYKYRSVSSLEGNVANLLHDIVKEMSQRVPLLLSTMLCAAVPASGKITQSVVPILASAYAILMKHRYDNLSAYHRLTSIIAMKGGLDERAQTRFNQLGLTLSWSGRVNLQDSVGKVAQNLIVKELRQNPLIKITGDNLDIFIKTSHPSQANRDLHMFTSNIIFSRIASSDMDNKIPEVDVSSLDCTSLTMTHEEKRKFKDAYAILLARIMTQIPSLKGYNKLFPTHIPHEYSQKMAKKSAIFSLPILMKNESRHDDCLAIMDEYEQQLINLHVQAFDNTNQLRRYGVPVGGDQLTRVRLSEAKTLRSLSVEPEKRLQDLHPIVCEMWHVKQDLLEKCYRTLYGPDMTQGTLKYFQTILHRSDVNGKVKGRFESHFNLLMLVGECFITEQFLEFLEMESIDTKPQSYLSKDISELTIEDQKDYLLKTIDKFMDHYGYGIVDCPENITHTTQESLHKVDIIKSEGQTILLKSHQNTKYTDSDELYNYSMLLCHWYLQISELHDTAKEGDLNRTVLNCQYSIPFFFSHSKLSKYLVEITDFVLKCKYMLSPLQRIRVLEGAYVNIKGGNGHNVESDLTQEHSVCNQKALIKSLGANKSDNSIKRVTGAADTVADICSKFDHSTQIKPKSGRHCKPLNDSDKDSIAKVLRRLRPFRVTPGRICPGFRNITKVPVSSDMMPSMKERLNQIVTRLTKGLHVHVEQDEEEDVGDLV